MNNTKHITTGETLLKDVLEKDDSVILHSVYDSLFLSDHE